MQSQLGDIFAASYVPGVLKAVKELPLDEDDLPEDCPFTLDQVLGDYWPEGH